MITASVQLSVRDGEKEEDRRHQAGESLERMAQEKERPDLVLLPEMWPCGFFDFRAYTESAAGTEENLGYLREQAKKYGIWILSGSMAEEEEGRYYNTAFLIDRTGRIAGKYRKIHLFGYESEERKRLTPGTEVSTMETEWGKAGLATCYDLRFPEQFRKMAPEGAVFFLIVSAWPSARLEHWRLFNQVRALENQCFLISCNCAGMQLGTGYAGHSMAVGPDGKICMEAGKEPGIYRARIDLKEVSAFRKAFPAWEDRVNL